MNLLIVEDEKEISEIMVELLSEDMKNIWTAEDGIAALDKMKEHPEINCVISDINMPRMDGIKLCQRLKADNPEIPVLLVTAEVSLESRGRAAGAVDVLIKPFMMEKFRSWVLEKLAMAQTATKTESATVSETQES